MKNKAQVEILLKQNSSKHSYLQWFVLKYEFYKIFKRMFKKETPAFHVLKDKFQIRLKWNNLFHRRLNVFSTTKVIYLYIIHCADPLTTN